MLDVTTHLERSKTPLPFSLFSFLISELGRGLERTSLLQASLKLSSFLQAPALLEEFDIAPRGASRQVNLAQLLNLSPKGIKSSCMLSPMNYQNPSGFL